jgi:hypothetical protein
MVVKGTRPHVLLVTVVALLVAGAWPAVVSAEHRWSNFHWTREANPLPASVGDNLDATWRDYLTTAASDWNQQPDLLVVTVQPGQTPSPDCVPVPGTIQVCNGEYGRTGWLGLAQVWNASGHIIQGTALLNDTYFNEPAYDNPPWRYLVMCQEVAHTFGLGHQDENQDNPNLGSCMDYSNEPEGPPSNEHPNQHDWDQLEEIYEHVDTVESFSAVASLTTEANELTTPPSEIKFPEVGGIAEVASLGAGGVEITTFVILADAEILARGAATPVATPAS